MSFINNVLFIDYLIIILLHDPFYEITNINPAKIRMIITY